MEEKIRISSGVSQLDHLLEGLYIGDNVVWYDDAGSLASVFCLNFIQISQRENKPVIYVTFDRSPRNLLDKLGPLSENPFLTILDCFTFGKGAGSPVFLKFYELSSAEKPYSIVRVEDPRQMDRVVENLYDLHAPMKGDVRLVFESLTGMAELWGGEDQVLQFYSHSCPRLYELNTVAYWVMEKKAHTPRFRAQINQIAQVAIDLSIKRGTTSLTILKAEKRELENFHKPHPYWVKDQAVSFDSEKRLGMGIDLGQRVKELRLKKGLSQTELAQLVGVTPSTISQVESNMIYPSLPGLLKMAEILSVEVSSFFQEQGGSKKRVIFSPREAVPVKFPDLPEGSISGKLLTPVDIETKAEPYLIEIPPFQTLSSHFFVHKGEEMGYLLAGELQVKMAREVYTLHAGEVICLVSEMPWEWKNLSPEPARLLWVKIK
ncbi:MAG: helix-turn-helix domain-containing protein [Deltaproteobacteria bacterium]|nr:helix-turn-helix domain-containing protein [Deltaproteobacteria bacterium]